MVGRLITGLIVLGPLVAAVGAAVWGPRIGLLDLLFAFILYMIAGHGIAIGFHRLFSHRTFRPSRGLKVGLAVAGSMAFEGGPIGWVADHRRHHVYADRDGDPHSPHAFGPGLAGTLRGLLHAHVGWLFSHAPSPKAQYAPDLLADPDLVIIDRLFPVWCVVSLAIPFALGWVVGGSIAAGFTTLLWAGLVRVFVLHHVTWSVNSVCHTFGRRAFRTRDRSGNVAALALVSFGESWHNAHHAFPTSARLGVDPGQIDSSAALIGVFERLGWAHDVRRADAGVRAVRRHGPQ